jgi:integrase
MIPTDNTSNLKSLSPNNGNGQNHRHDHVDDGTGYEVCSCGLKKLVLIKTDKEGLLKGSNTNYSVRANRDRFFYPNEWMKFYDLLKDSQKMTFDFLMQTGCRINEAIHVKAGDIDFERNTIILRVTKVKAKKGEKNPRPRTISISRQFAGRLKKYVNANNLKNEDYLGLLSAPAAHIAMKGAKRNPGGALVKAGIQDWYMFSIHNIRKTHGNYLKALQATSESEICKRLGHDYNTFLKAYVSADIFNFKDIQNMKLILGDIYQR